jgi:hypothetical protein
MHFNETGSVHRSLIKVARRLQEIGIDYAVAGGMALFRHGYRRFTEDIDILVNREGLQLIHDRLEGLGYLRPFAGSKNLRDTETGVRIEFLITGQFPGDGKPSDLPFPEPSEAGIEIDGISYLSLDSLINLKLASGLTNPLRAKDIGDVIALIEIVKPPRELVEKLAHSTREKYLELWDAVEAARGSEQP